MHLLVLNGPNLNLLGLREPEHYGSRTYDDLVALIEHHCAQKGIAVTCRQSNHEGVLVELIQEAIGRYDGIVINPAAYTHTSIVLLDALKAVGLPTVEVHISDPDTREDFRRISYVRSACLATVKGKGLEGYLEAVDILVEAIAAL
jgi:3-dehydroquinate dehydratase-2